MRRAVARIKHPLLEVLLFHVGGARYGVELGQVVGLVQGLPGPGGRVDWGSGDRALFEGREVPVFHASDFMAEGVHAPRNPKEAIVFDDGKGLYGMAVDGTGDVIEVTPGDDLYTFPPQPVSDGAPLRPWGYLDLGERPVLLVDLSPVVVH